MLSKHNLNNTSRRRWTWNMLWIQQEGPWISFISTSLNSLLYQWLQRRLTHAQRRTKNKQESSKVGHFQSSLVYRLINVFITHVRKILEFCSFQRILSKWAFTSTDHQILESFSHHFLWVIHHNYWLNTCHCKNVVSQYVKACLCILLLKLERFSKS